MARPRSEGREAYLNLREELTPLQGFPTATLEDFDPGWVGAAREYARKNKKAWPPRPMPPDCYIMGVSL